MQKIYLGVPMCEPVELGTFTDGVYALLTWGDGEVLEVVLPKLSEIEQYNLGLKSGEILRIINSVPAQKNEESQAVKYNCKIDNTLRMYHENEANRFESSEYFLKLC